MRKERLLQSFLAANYRFVHRVNLESPGEKPLVKVTAPFTR
ncbi:hypothetical protein N9164_05480 [Draconibacterium sp.]|nr:hypothetical protein [Draconibacterium sp.]